MAFFLVCLFVLAGAKIVKQKKTNKQEQHDIIQY